MPRFIDQVREGRYNVTDPAMTRFMMSLEQADWFYLRLLTENRVIFCLKSSLRTIELLAKTISSCWRGLITELKYIGTRHGEKLYETSLTKEEMSEGVDLGEYYRVPADIRDLN